MGVDVVLIDVMDPTVTGRLRVLDVVVLVRAIAALVSETCLMEGFAELP